jgi:hypothetical protein
VAEVAENLCERFACSSWSRGFQVPKENPKNSVVVVFEVRDYTFYWLLGCMKIPYHHIVCENGKAVWGSRWVKLLRLSIEPYPHIWE